jgi:hypothetical protein
MKEEGGVHKCTPAQRGLSPRYFSAEGRRIACSLGIFSSFSVEGQKIAQKMSFLPKNYIFG